MSYLARLVRRELWKARLRRLARRYRTSRRIVIAKRRGDRWGDTYWIGKPPACDLLRVALYEELGSVARFLDMSPREVPIANFRPVVMAYKRPGFTTVVKWITWEVVR